MRETIIQLARQFEGCPYIWGGNLPWEGLDCSGYIQFILRPFGILPRDQDLSAAQIAELFEETFYPEPGDLAVYTVSGRIAHADFYIGDGQVLGMRGGDSSIKTVAQARARNAECKVLPVNYWKALSGYRNILRRAGTEVT